ncbi:GGDEF domain-containing protein [Streptomyces sp. NPDC060027]|uniref:GGDEF domain-containing protein n=1 Tax=Streptomyces sp. NPDC060027 TaxID=3347040 RepID=UPI003698FDA0
MPQAAKHRRRPDGPRTPFQPQRRRTVDTQALAAVLPLVGWAAHSGLLPHRLAAARRDPLTGLHTRAGWTARATRLIRRHSDALVVLVDLDGFKTLNDTYGHPAGDTALTVAASRLTAWCGRHGIAGRLGGDEFVAVIDQAAGPDLTDLGRDLHRPFLYARQSLPLAASVGSCRLTDLPTRTLPCALAAADAAMYAAKGRAARRGQRPVSH